MLIRLALGPLEGRALWIPGFALALAIAFLALRKAVFWLRPVNVDRTGNGIAVSSIKVYDNRFLTVRLAELEKGLQKLATLDSSNIADSAGTIQGKLVSNTDFSVAAKPGKSEPQESKSAGEAAKSPTPDDKLALSAKDRLSDQVNLQYEILGLRMILERSLSDRFWKDGDTNNARLQAVLGFQVSLDPGGDSSRSAAIVEVTFRERNSLPLSVVALLPQEESHSLLFTTSRTQSADGSLTRAGTRWLGRWRHERQSQAIVREPDTVAFQRPPQTVPSPLGPLVPEREQNSLTVGWQFRPPLDQPAVRPGVRQVFAILAIPAADPVSEPAESIEVATLHATVRSYWRRYNRGTRTTSPRWGLLLPWTVRDQEREDLRQCIKVNSTQAVQRLLKPEVKAIRTSLVGPETVLVMIDGSNFFPGTTVAIDKFVYSAEGGLLIKSDYHMQVTTTPQALSRGTGEINGRYGPTVALKIEPPVPAIYISGCTVDLSGDGKFDWLQIYISNAEGGKDLTVDDLMKLPSPIVMVDDKVLPPPFYLLDPDEASADPNTKADTGGEETKTEAPEDAAASEKPTKPGRQESKPKSVVYGAWVASLWNPTTARFKLVFPFCGDEYQQAFGVTDNEPSFTIVRSRRENTDLFVIAIRGGEFENQERWSVELDQKYQIGMEGSPLVRLSKLQLLLCVPHPATNGCEMLIVRYSDPATDGYAASVTAYPVPIPVVADVAKPSFAKQLVTISTNEGATADLEGLGLNAVAKVYLRRNGASRPVESRVSSEGKKLTLLVPAGLSPGFGELLFEDNSQAEVGRVSVLLAK